MNHEENRTSDPIEEKMRQLNTGPTPLHLKRQIETAVLNIKLSTQSERKVERWLFILPLLASAAVLFIVVLLALDSKPRSTEKRTGLAQKVEVKLEALMRCDYLEANGDSAIIRKIDNTGIEELRIGKGQVLFNATLINVNRQYLEFEYENRKFVLYRKA